MFSKNCYINKNKNMTQFSLIPLTLRMKQEYNNSITEEQDNQIFSRGEKNEQDSL
ncbi:hypothetical protein HMSSN036_15570 [Paenibacillus macerans]|nr:hypothetical protein HMSSN036_15570 [Paenibacillus macerans]